jgi:hypothetical protein
MIYFYRAVETNPTGRVIMAKGGRGDIASSPESKKLDSSTKKVMNKIASNLESKYFFEKEHVNDKSNKRKLPEFENLGVSLGCVPDGGFWFDSPRGQSRKLCYVFESKHQNEDGNAIERWGTNYLLCKSLNPQVKYITFMSGKGCAEGKILHKYAESMKKISENCIFYLSENGFDEEQIESIMIKYLAEEKL